jgi:hypothetical protein
LCVLTFRCQNKLSHAVTSLHSHSQHFSGFLKKIKIIPSPIFIFVL